MNRDCTVRLLKIHTENIIILYQFWKFKANTTKKSRFNNILIFLVQTLKALQRLIVDIFFDIKIFSFIFQNY